MINCPHLGIQMLASPLPPSAELLRSILKLGEFLFFFPFPPHSRNVGMEFLCIVERQEEVKNQDCLKLKKAGAICECDH